MEFSHKSVLYSEVLESLNIRKDKNYLDATIGGAGHSLGIAKKLEGSGLLIGIDQDEEALKKSGEVLKDYSNVKLLKSNFKDFDKVLASLHINKIDGVLLDLGVSSYQFDNGERGFSYRYNARLDMRMDRNQKISAYEIVNNYSEEELIRIIRDFGEERWAERISKFIVDERKDKKIVTTFDLVDVIKKAVPKGARQNGPHPAKRTFQAIRIEVNHELDILRDTIFKLVHRLNPGGRIAIISFHSLEDRIVKDAFKYLFLDCICPPDQPICTCNKKREIKIITRKPILPSKEELLENNRSHSAKLRVAEKEG
ncbi:16S rRNA (cytosine(1402)-N(4))-methyltransferase RsmH [uncultured Peptoniphilus sp.]|uniref:16S rRNA (cytosine(1402)-N(4))-methyltransferase RsmH n=1 Tax=uncultured Peptoniphilus sp. TaxID=254354 RepID=UPI002804ECB1|nr:16S rRNA (cytosine(1402)-N(4))-methyltransferase RsmH [uncultured Peptoniphilus sp.]